MTASEQIQDMIDFCKKELEKNKENWWILVHDVDPEKADGFEERFGFDYDDSSSRQQETHKVWDRINTLNGEISAYNFALDMINQVKSGQRAGL